MAKRLGKGNKRTRGGDGSTTKAPVQPPKRRRASHGKVKLDAAPPQPVAAPVPLEDAYEAEEGDAEEDKCVYKFDHVDNYEYEMPSDFEDEEIDEDEAFNSEDERKYGAWFENREDGTADSEGGYSDLEDSDSDPGEAPQKALQKRGGTAHGIQAGHGQSRRPGRDLGSGDHSAVDPADVDLLVSDEDVDPRPTGDELFGEVTLDADSSDDPDSSRPIHRKQEHQQVTQVAKEGVQAQEQTDDEADDGALRSSKGELQVDDLLDEVFGDVSTASSEDELEGASESEDGQGTETEAGALSERHQALLSAVRGQRAATRVHKDPNRRVLSEAYPEDDHHLNPLMAIAGSDHRSLTVMDLINGLGDAAGALGAARKTLEKVAKGAPVQAPLPPTVRDRQTRKAGYQTTTKDVSKWTGLVQANREAPTLRFEGADKGIPHMSTTAALAATFKPETELEEQVAELLAKAQEDEDQAVAEAEEQLAVRTQDPEELAARQEQLSRMRSVLFHHERRLKRLAKIKSKDYRRRLKKAAQKQAEKAGQTDDNEALRKAAEEAEFERAKERITLKHKNSSRWARRALRRGVTVMDDGTKEALAEQLRIGQEIRQRVNALGRPKGSDESASDGGSTSASDDEGGPAANAHDSAARKAAMSVLLGKDSFAGELPSKGLFGLPFMQRALKKHQQESRQAATNLLSELDGHKDDQDDGTSRAEGSARRGRVTYVRDAAPAWGTMPPLDDDHPASVDEEAMSSGNEDEDATTKAARIGKAPRSDNAGPTKPGNGGKTPNGQQPRISSISAEALNSTLQKTRSRLHAQSNGFVVNGVAVPAAPCNAPAAGQASGKPDIDGTAPLRVTANGHCQEYVPAATFAGARPGCVYKKGHLGVGYYRERSTGGAAATDSRNGTVVQQTDQLVQLRDAGAAVGASAGGGHSREKSKVAYVDAGTVVNTAAVVQVQRDGGAGNTNGKGPPAAEQNDSRGNGNGGGEAVLMGDKGSDSEAYSSDDAREQRSGGSNGKRGQQRGGQLIQQELILRAFAGDDVAEEFDKEKAAEVDAEHPMPETPGVLPGWGAWAGSKRTVPKAVLDAQARAKREREAAMNARKDAGLGHVIISEKWDKKASRHVTHTLPYPYTTPQAYELSMRQPLGRDYNTDQAFRDMTRPAVLKTTGMIIKPARFNAALHEDLGKRLPVSKQKRIAVMAAGKPRKVKA